jgi:hypothetical protein
LCDTQTSELPKFKAAERSSTLETVHNEEGILAIQQEEHEVLN